MAVVLVMGCWLCSTALTLKSSLNPVVPETEGIAAKEKDRKCVDQDR